MEVIPPQVAYQINTTETKAPWLGAGRGSMTVEGLVRKVEVRSNHGRERQLVLVEVNNHSELFVAPTDVCFVRGQRISVESCRRRRPTPRQ